MATVKPVSYTHLDVYKRQIHALNFVMYAALGGSVTRSLSVDMHGKGLSSYLLDMDI